MVDSLNKTNFKPFTKEFLDNYYGVNQLHELQKSDSPVLTTVAAMFNAVFGRTAFSQLNEDHITLKALPKVQFSRTGWRIKTARGFTIGQRGVAEGGNVGNAVRPTIVQVSTRPKTMDLSVATSRVYDLLNEDDKLEVTWLMENLMTDHMKDMNSALLAPNTTAAGNNFESIDRVCSSAAEIAAFTALEAGDIDMYGLDRDSASVLDAYVDLKADDGASDLRNVSIPMLRNAHQNIYTTSGKKPNMIITGADQANNITNLFQSETRFSNLPETRVSFGIDGMYNTGGQELGLTVYSFDQIPVIVDADVFKEASGGSRIYFINTDTLFLSMLENTRVTTLDRLTVLQSYDTKVNVHTIGELICTQFNANGKIRDLN